MISNKSGFGLIIQKEFEVKQMKKENEKLKSAETARKFRKDASSAKKTQRVLLEETPEVLASRLRTKKWEEKNKERVQAKQKRHAEKKRDENKAKIALALQQIAATERNMDWMP